MNATKAIVTKAISRALLWTGIVLAATCFANIYTTDTTFDKPAPVGSYADVLEKNICKDTVVGEFPTGAVLREVGAGYLFTTNDKMIGKALDEKFASKPWKRFDVIHFCK